MSQTIKNALQLVDKAIGMLDDLVADGKYGDQLDAAFDQLADAGNNIEKVLKKLQRQDARG